MPLSPGFVANVNYSGPLGLENPNLRFTRISSPHRCSRDSQSRSEFYGEYFVTKYKFTPRRQLDAGDKSMRLKHRMIGDFNGQIFQGFLPFSLNVIPGHKKLYRH